MPVQVVKPYPVPIPHVRPVFHHSRPRDEAETMSETDLENDFDDEHIPPRFERPDSRIRPSYLRAKKPKR